MGQTLRTAVKHVVAAWRRPLLGGLLLVLALLAQPALADDKVKLFATTEAGFARLIIDFPDRLDLPHYTLDAENGVLAVQFATPVSVTLPDIVAALPDYISVARVDPDGKGIRFGLRTTLTVNHMEAGEQLFVDLMPSTWQGLPPGLPAAVVANLAARAKQAAIDAEQARKAEEAKRIKPVASVRVGRNPTFMRVQFDWSADTEAKFSFDGTIGKLVFDWPVPIDLVALKTDLPPPLQAVAGAVGPAGSEVTFHTDGKATPRFYAVSKRDFIVDFDTANAVPADPDPRAAATAGEVAAAVAAAAAPAPAPGPLADGPFAWAAPALAAIGAAPPGPITPAVTTAGATVRIAFPFVRDTPAAVFRRGNTVWMLFDTPAGINQPVFTPELAALAHAFTVLPAGDMQVVRLDLDTGRLATLGSEGRTWVLSIGDMLLAPTAPMALARRADRQGRYQVVADLDRPGRVHQFTDPLVGDTLAVVTAFPPARGMTRDLGYVDFDALRSVQGLVIKPKADTVNVAIDGKLAVVSAPEGLIVTPPDALPHGELAAPVERDSFIDLVPLREIDPVKFSARVDQLIDAAAVADAGARDVARLNLARFYLANHYAHEALAVLAVERAESKSPELQRGADLMVAAAQVVADRPADALAILDTDTFKDDADARLWRAIAQTALGNYAAARTDALAAEGVVSSYPAWVRARFRLSGLRAAIESDDLVTAERFHRGIEFASLEGDEISRYQLLGGRLAEAEGRDDEALDTYGQVIAADVRPTRAEAVYRTLLVLNRTGGVDPAKAAKTLAAEALLWRGDRLEADMDRLLAGLYFRLGDYRDGFETAHAALVAFPDSPAMDALAATTRAQFEDLYLNGKADALPPIEALALYYDFRGLTPPGQRGDEMIRNLAGRLVKVDLLGQAADLLKYQIDNRLKGAARAQVATDLAFINIADRKPDAALQVLNGTALAELPPTLERRRRILTARALIDAKRFDLALDVLNSLQGRDADQLRIDANWAAGNYQSVGDELETMYSPGIDGAAKAALAPPARMQLVRAAVAYALAGDRIGLTRLRGKFADLMAGGAEWPMFDYVTASIEPARSPQFNAVLHAVAGVDSLDAFLKSYAATYGETAPVAENPPATGPATAAIPRPPAAG